ncbi:radical SAM protein [Prochlorococcus sp. MIT 1300]|uniref:B12-binding domain-containing radical SAM protein n=1 Tax=Prochlorococcus sp. MIT 1300 TaxID=3096218 RepID=UPI002A752542|nr:radical SAM protein [Prochlorococcus sp. MIT 1300]
MLAFPSTYEVGITSLGYQIIWSTLAQREDIHIKRLFTDQGDQPHQKCDLFGLSLSWELDGPVLLDLLEKSRIPLWSFQRKENDPIVFGGGPVLTANPEPLAPFFDVILLGDGEELLPNFIETCKKIRGEKRFKQLQALATIPGIYVPSLYEPQFSSDGNFLGVIPIDPTIPSSISKQTWKSNTLSHSTVITPDSAWPNIHMIEVVRSCPELCRFCLASYLTLPFRTSSLNNGLLPALEKGLKVTKRIGLLGASVTQHPEFPELMQWLNKEKFNDIHLSVSSVRASTVNTQLTNILAKRGSKSITIAIESGSERIRKVINKKLLEEEIYSAARYTLEGGLKALKLYGMVGLPSEEEEDVDKTAELLINLKKAVPQLRLKLGVSTFVPKAHTPFQWDGINKDAAKRLKYLNKKLKPKGIDIRPESYRLSVIQTLLSRSDRRLAPVIARMRCGENSLSAWKKTYNEVRNQDLYSASQPTLRPLPPPPPWEEVVHKRWDECNVLPWNHIKGPLGIDRLLEHRHLALENNGD